MVYGAVATTAIRIGRVAYRIYREQYRAIGKAYRGYPRYVRKGVQHGAGLGAALGGAIEYAKQEEEGGNMIGLPERQSQRPNYRQQKTRNKIFKSSSKRGFCQKCADRCRR